MQDMEVDLFEADKLHGIEMRSREELNGLVDRVKAHVRTAVRRRQFLSLRDYWYLICEGACALPMSARSKVRTRQWLEAKRNVILEHVRSYGRPGVTRGARPPDPFGLETVEGGLRISIAKGLICRDVESAGHRDGTVAFVRTRFEARVRDLLQGIDRNPKVALVHLDNSLRGHRP